MPRIVGFRKIADSCLKHLATIEHLSERQVFCCRDIANLCAAKIDRYGIPIVGIFRLPLQRQLGPNSETRPYSCTLVKLKAGNRRALNYDSAADLRNTRPSRSET